MKQVYIIATDPIIISPSHSRHGAFGTSLQQIDHCDLHTKVVVEALGWVCGLLRQVETDSGMGLRYLPTLYYSRILVVEKSYYTA